MIVMLPYGQRTRLQMEDFRVRMEDRPGWVRGTARLPEVGEEVFCAGGAGTVTALHGKTENGSRLVQVALAASPRSPFYAAASNLLLPPVDAGSPRSSHGFPDGAEPWLSGSGQEHCLG